MEKENETQAAVAETEETDAEELTSEEELADDTDWKAEAIKARRIATRYRNKAVKLAEAKKEPKQESKTEAAAPAPLDYAQLAFLAANGIKEPGEIALVEAALKNSGKELKDLLGSKWFQAELKEYQDDAASKAATPKGSDRSTSSGKDTVDYWLKEGGLPPIEQMELRRKVVAARTGKAAGHFYNSPR